MKVLIVDDHPIVIRGCAHLLEDAGVKQFIGASDADEGYAAYLRERPDVAIVDLSMGRDKSQGLRFISLLREKEWHTPIIVLSVHTDLNVVASAVQLGVSAYVLKDSSAREFQEAFRSVLAGRRYMSEGLAQQIAFNRGGGREPLSNLSPSEYEILELMAAGNTYEFIAAQLKISKKTVVQTVASLKKRLGAPTLNDLLYVALTTKRSLNGSSNRHGRNAGELF
ncbi:MAG: response regulator transcription factor [Hyphomicrobium sp.]